MSELQRFINDLDWTAKTEHGDKIVLSSDVLLKIHDWIFKIENSSRDEFGEKISEIFFSEYAYDSTLGSSMRLYLNAAPENVTRYLDEISDGDRKALTASVREYSRLANIEIRGES